MQKKIKKMLFVSEIFASELGPLDSLFKAENSCDRHSVS